MIEVMDDSSEINPGVAEAIKIAGSQEKLAAQIGICQTTVSYCLRKKCTPENAVKIFRATGVPREKIRPDIFLLEAA